MNSLELIKQERNQGCSCNVRRSRFLVVAALMKDEGYDVTGITLKLYDDTNSQRRKTMLCTRYNGRKRVSEKINIKHEILYYQKFRSEVIDSFIDVMLREKLQFHVFNVIKLSNLEIFLNMLRI